MIVMLLFCECDQKVNAVSLHIDPNRAQFFQYESVIFYCEGVFYCEIIHDSKGEIPSCKTTTKGTQTGSSCTVNNVYPADSGKYWFDAGGGKRSNSVNIVVTNGSVILEIPALPVMEGEAVTLTCRNKMTSSQTLAHFYHYGLLVSNSFKGNMIIHNVSKSDEGPYKCSISGAGESAESWLTVRDGQKVTATPSSKELINSFSNFTTWIFVTVLVAVVVVVVVGLIYFAHSYWHKVMYVSTVRPGSDSPGNQTVEYRSSCGRSYYNLGLNDTQQHEQGASDPLAHTNPEDIYYSTIQ
ncbi:low affinity immunoglobulin gamma Fc region receptor III-like [Anabas testudineus]|nr:low affinity immunoglobulin gamma Fc region receptor III-like [Anabas testudineus]